MSKTIFDYVQAKEIATYYTEAVSNKIPYLGETLFPRKKQLGLELSWIKGAKGLPVALKSSAFDTKADLRDRIGFQEIQTNMPFFKEGMLIKENDRQELNKVLSTGNQNYIDLVINKIYDDSTNLIEGAEAQEERMRMQLLSTGKVQGKDGAVAYDYDYGMQASQKETLKADNRWSQFDTSNPVADIQKWKESIEDATGESPTRAICTRKTFTYLMNNAKLRADMSGSNADNVIMTDAILTQYLSAKLGLTIQVYNKKFADSSGETKAFFPDDVFTLIPNKTLGNTYHGTTPEESDLMSSNQANVSIVNGGMAITTTEETDPVNVFTKVSVIMMPSFESIDEVFIATVG